MKGMRYLIIIFLILTIPVNGQKRNTYGFYNTGNTPFYVLWANETLAPEISLEGWYEVPAKDDVSVTTYGGNSANLFAFAKRNKDGNLVSIGLYRRSNKKQVNYMEVPVSLISGKLNQRYSLDKADAKRNTPDITEGYVPFTLYIMDKGYTVDYDEYEQINMSVDENTPTFTVVPKSQARKKIVRPRLTLPQNNSGRTKVQSKKVKDEYAKGTTHVNPIYHKSRKAINPRDCFDSYSYFVEIQKMKWLDDDDVEFLDLAFAGFPRDTTSFEVEIKEPIYTKIPSKSFTIKYHPRTRSEELAVIDFIKGGTDRLRGNLIICEEEIKSGKITKVELAYVRR